MMKSLRQFLFPVIVLCLALLPGSAYAGAGTITVKDSGGVVRTYVVTTNGSGNFLANVVLCDATAGANCVAVSTSGGLRAEGSGASGAALAGNPFRVGLSDGTNNQNWLAALALADGVNGNNTGAVANWLYNGTTWDRARSASTATGATLTDIVPGGTLATLVATGTALNGTTYPGSSIGFGCKDGSGNIQPAAAATPCPVAMYGGTTAVTVKAGGTTATTSDTALVTALRPATPMTPIVAAASDNHTVVKNGAGTAFSIHASNNSATANYARLYDAGTGFNGCNSATGVIFAFEIPPSNSGFSIGLGGSRGLAFTNGLSFCITSGFGLTDTTAATASAILFNVSYN